MKILKTLSLLLLLNAASFGTAIRGTLVNAGGGALTGGTLTITLSSLDGNGNTVSGCAGGTAPNVRNSGTITSMTTIIMSGAGGALFGTVVGNDQINCGAGFGVGSFYHVVAKDATGLVAWTKDYNIVGATWTPASANLNTLPPSVLAVAILSNPGGNQTITQPGGTSLTISGNVNIASLTASIIGNAATATALASTPTSCVANTFATAIDTRANLTCSGIAPAQLPAQVVYNNQANTFSSSPQTFNQAANGNDVLFSKRATDTAPTGNFSHFKNAANTSDLWTIDIAGILQAGIVPAARVSGTLAAGNLPNPSATTLGGTESFAPVAHQWINSISTAGVPIASQPAAADLSNGTSGSGAVALTVSPVFTTPALGSATVVNLTFNSAAPGSGAALTVGGTSSTTGGLSIFVGAAGSASERLAVYPADGSVAATRIGSLSVRAINAGFLSGAENASISNSGAMTGSSLNLGGTGTLATTAQSGTGSLCMTTSCAMTTPSFAGSMAPSTAGGINAGTASLPFSGIFIGGAATNNIRITGTATAARTMTLPDANSNTIQPAAAGAHQFANAISSAGVITFSQPASTDLSDVTSLVTLTGTQTLSSKTLTSPIISTGVSQGSGFKHQRAAGCTTPAGVGGVCGPTTLTWTSPFADTNYSFTCYAVVTSGQAFTLTTSKLAASVTYALINETAAVATASEFDCIAIHD